MTLKVSSLVRTFEESATLALSGKAKKMKADGRSVVNFGVGEPDFNTPEPIIEAAYAAAKKGETKYTAVGGSPAARKAIASRLSQDYGLSFLGDDMILSSGGKQAIFHFLQATLERSDEVLIFSPYWVSFPEMVKMVGAKPVIVPTREGRFDGAALTKAITPKTKLCILNNPSNPAGTYWGRDELKEMLRILKPHDIGLLSDDTYYTLLYEGSTWTSVLSLDPDFRDRTCIVGSSSKAYAMTGWRLGWALAPRPVIDAMVKLQGQVTSNPSSLAQAATLYAVTEGHSVAEDFRQRFDKRRHFMVSELERHQGWSWMKPEGAFYIFLNIGSLVRGSVADFAACALEEKGLCVIPGEAFGVPDYIRLSYALGEEDIREGVARLAALLFSRSSY